MANKLKILSLDGGGIRGLSTLLILKRVFYRIKMNLTPPQPALEPWQYFDFIGGTSTGGIIALMLGRLRMSIEECIEEYHKIGERVFGQKRTLHSFKYDEKIMEDIMKQVIKEAMWKRSHMNEQQPGLDLGRVKLLDTSLLDHNCKTAVCTLSGNNAEAQPQLLRTYRSSHERTNDIEIWQAARATSAAPTFFAPIELNLHGTTQVWIDAGFGSNNPALAIWEELQRLYIPLGSDLDLREKVGLFLSLGTGFSDVHDPFADTWKNRFSKIPRFPLNWIIVMRGISTNTEHAHHIMQNNIKVQGYFRFNVEQGLQRVHMTDYKKMRDIGQDTDMYLNSHLAEVERCVVCAIRLERPSVASPTLSSIHEFVGTPSSPPSSPQIYGEQRRPLNPARSPFYQLNATSRYLKEPPMEGERYWNRVTIHGLEIYEKVYALMTKSSKGYISYSHFVDHFEPYNPKQGKIRIVWDRLRLGQNWAPRNYVLALLFMLHVESDQCFPEERPFSKRGSPEISESREKVIQSYGNWVPCFCGSVTNQDSCGLQWAFSNNSWGICRGYRTRDCLISQNLTGRLENAADIERANGLRKAMVDEWKSERQVPLPFELAQ